MVMIQEEEQVKEKEPTPPSPTSSSSLDYENLPPQKIRSLQELYEVTTPLNLICLCVNEEIVSFEEAIKDSKWKKTMDEEMKAIEKNETWHLTTLPNGHKPIGVKWVYKIKKNAQGEIEKYKARLVAKGYKQKVDIYYKELFTLVARIESIRLIISLTAQLK
ncbi:uncharacterized mitochondrial protein AtMg00820-like [Zingiber officinale]|uniref:uncharacterized mitochondrial protein AtMg00820-like n=1 Tax=Zingiber officinale TaxID=94328 RepID=UPI001C4ACE4E|nr:uncharacterized mitochondrial protein AtMg00820-like [Zingiber officinale]